jgi:hypothetical protein
MAEVGPETADSGASEPVGSTKLLLERVLDDMESLGIVTELAGKVLLRSKPRALLLCQQLLTC